LAATDKEIPDVLEPVVTSVLGQTAGMDEVMTETLKLGREQRRDLGGQAGFLRQQSEQASQSGASVRNDALSWRWAAAGVKVQPNKPFNQLGPDIRQSHMLGPHPIGKMGNASKVAANCAARVTLGEQMVDVRIYNGCKRAIDEPVSASKARNYRFLVHGGLLEGDRASSKPPFLCHAKARS
jgi:hypothetical protein